MGEGIAVDRRSEEVRMAGGVRAFEAACERAAEAIRGAKGLLVTAGAGMGVDSGLPDFRGPEGFWRAYPPYRKLGLVFEELARPDWFERDPELAWGFYGHRLALYRATVPHRGFSVLRRWGASLAGGCFVFTTNVDGQFQKAGFGEEAILEYHGAIGHLQCLRGCGAGIFPAGDAPEVDPETFRARPPLPACPACRSLARPNVLMFWDAGWDGSRSDAQARRLQRWLARFDPVDLVVVECGAGTAIPSARRFGERLQRQGARLIRINPREADGPAGTISVAGGAADALFAIDRRLAASR